MIGRLDLKDIISASVLIFFFFYFLFGLETLDFGLRTWTWAWLLNKEFIYFFQLTKNIFRFKFIEKYSPTTLLYLRSLKGYLMARNLSTLITDRVNIGTMKNKFVRNILDLQPKYPSSKNSVKLSMVTIAGTIRSCRMLERERLTMKMLMDLGRSLDDNNIVPPSRTLPMTPMTTTRQTKGSLH